MKFFSAIAILLLAIFLQLFFISIGWHGNLALASLIAFAFIFDFWELLVLDLLAVFILNWKPAPSVALVVFALIPIGAFLFRKFIPSERWIGNLIAIFVGFIIFYLIAGPTFSASEIILFVEDVIVCLLTGEAILYALV